jgi:hypothetical protein
MLLEKVKNRLFFFNEKYFKIFYNINLFLDGKDEYGYPVYQNCTCNNCLESCTNTFEFKGTFFKLDTGFLDGFDGVTVGVLYAVLILITTI